MATFAEEMVEKLEAVLRVSVSLQSVTFGGQTVALTDLEKRYDSWKARAGQEVGRRPFLRPLTMEGPRPAIDPALSRPVEPALRQPDYSDFKYSSRSAFSSSDSAVG